MKIKSLVASALLAATALPLFGTAYRPNQLTWTDTFSLGQWICRDNDAKSFAKSHNTPMIIVYSKTGNTLCSKFEREIGDTTDLKTWAQSKGYVLVYVFEIPTAAEYGLSKKDQTDALAFCTKLNPEAPTDYPLVGVWWPKNPKTGKEVKAGFIGREGRMGTSGSYIEQFKAAVDNLVGDYVSPTTLTVNFNANGGTINDAEKTRLTVAGKTIGMFPAATRAGYRVTGWTTAASGGTAVKTSTKMTDGATYYAQWKRAVTLTLKDSPVGEGKLVGAGQYDEGTTVAVKTAPTNKGIFQCWKDSKGNVKSEVPKFKYTLGSEDVTLTAYFISKQEDYDSIKATVKTESKTIGLIVDTPFPLTLDQGVMQDWSLEPEAKTTPTPTVTGLPSGLKLVKDKKTGKYSITGAPTAVSKADKNGNVKPSNVTIKVKTAGGNAKTYKLAITVKARPAWTEGVFNGYAGTDSKPVGVIYNLTVAANGKVSGKLLRDGFTYSLSASSLKKSGDTYSAEIDGKAKGSVVSFKATFSKDVNGSYSIGVISADGDEWVAVQTPWKTNDKLKALAKKIAKAKPLTITGALGEFGDVSLKFGASGTVTVKGGGVSTAAVLMPDSEEPTVIPLYFYLAPKKAFPGYAARIILKWDDPNFSL